ncbi:MAG: DegV family protein [Clostridiales bacterium]|nr:DegV family protein [Clostridiales bacterium]
MYPFDLITDATIDLPRPLYKKLDFTAIPMRYYIDGEEFLHSPGPSQMSLEPFYRMLKGGANMQTTTLTPEQFMEAFSHSLEQGRDVIYIGLSSALSGTFSYSLPVAEELRARYPDRRIYCIDTLSVAGGQGILLTIADALRAKGATAEEVAAELERRRPELAIWFSVDDLTALKRSGRLGGIVATASAALGIRPTLHVTNAGKLGLGGSARGTAKAIRALVAQLQKTFKPEASNLVIILHSNCEQDAIALRDAVLEAVPAADPQISELGPVVGTHVGSGCIAMCFCATER